MGGKDKSILEAFGYSGRFCFGVIDKLLMEGGEEVFLLWMRQNLILNGALILFFAKLSKPKN